MNAYLPGYASLLISLIPFALAPLLIGLAFWLYYLLRKRTNIYIALLSLASFWTGYEYLHQSWDLAFPWMTLGNGFANFHQLIQWYNYTGVYGGTWWIWISNIFIFLLYLHSTGRYVLARPVLIKVGLLSVIFFPPILSIIQYSTYEEHINPSQVVVVQPNIDPYGKFGPISPEEQLETLVRLSESVAPPHTEYFIWPETAISAREGINEETFRDYPAYQRTLSFLDHFKNGSVLSGIESYIIYPDQRTSTARAYSNVFVDHFNSSVLIDNSTKLQYYHKSKLVPGAEQLPFGNAVKFMKPLFQHFGGATGSYGKQDEPSVLYSQSGIGAAPVICYESIWGDYVAKYIEKGAQFIAIVTNDGWWGNTSGKDQHLLYAKLRAIENRRWIARSANTGISGFINQRGDIVQSTDWWTEDALVQEINLNEELTFYTRNGDKILYISLLFTILGLVSAVFIKNHRK